MLAKTMINDDQTPLAGRYQLAEVIGRGGMGTVYRATDLLLDRIVAVKILSSSSAEEAPVRVARFEREARSTAALAHPGVVAVFDCGVDQDRRFIVMELISGRSLAAVLRYEAPLEVDRAVEIVARVADAVAAAHFAGIIHRDLKPGNVMLAKDGSIRVLDFGIARVLDATAITVTASVLGSAAYMSPEQARGEPADERSDIYSLGCVLYALLAGRPPFGAETVAAVLHEQIGADPRPLRDLNADVSPGLEALVAQMLAKSAAARPASASQLREQLRETMEEPEEPTGATTLPTEPIADSKAIATLRRRALWTSFIGSNRRIAGGSLAILLSVVAGIALVDSVGAGSSVNLPIGRGIPPRSTPASTPAGHRTGPAGVARQAPNRSLPGPGDPGDLKQPEQEAKTQPAPLAQPQMPPGHGGVPPGQAKKYGYGSEP